MQYRKLGFSGLLVSPICLGTMMFGDRTDEKEAARIVALARDAGVNFIDLADLYAGGEAERIIGRLIAADRDDWVVATKGGAPMRGETRPNRQGFGRKWLMRAIGDSLKRLGTDHVDIYYMHKDFLWSPLDELVETMGDLIRQGKVRYFALSNFAAWRIAEIMHLCHTLGVPRPICLQPYYNALNRTPELEIFSACHYYGIGAVPYSPVARGVLTGKYLPGATPAPDSRAGRKERRIMETEFRPESLAIAQRFKAYAEKRGMTATQFAFNWVINSQVVPSAVAGPRTAEQWQEYLAGLAHTLTPEDEAFVDSLVPPGHPSTHGYTDPMRPVTGRMARGAG
ncbi:MAG: aldo/keto reductase [Alphaproteobacteria bacterium]|nr:aldo/keto reductase [Alphaproteobacteria bacterium]